MFAFLQWSVTQIMQMLICSFVWFRFPFMLWPTDMVSTLKISISFNLNLSVAWINWTSGTESLNEGRSCSRSSFLFIWNYSSGSEVVFFTSGSGKPVKTQWVKYRRFTSWILVWRQQHASAERFFSFFCFCFLTSLGVILLTFPWSHDFFFSSWSRKSV